MIKLGYMDFVLLQDLAKDELLAMPKHMYLKGMTRYLYMEEKRILALYAATISILNKNGLIKEGIPLHYIFDLDELKGEGK